MDKIEKLTPVIVLITATLINHCCKEKKELTWSDFLIFVSPSVPTLVPILIQIFTDFLTSILEFIKTFETLKSFELFKKIDIFFEFLKTFKKNPKIEKPNQSEICLPQNIKSGPDHVGYEMIQVDADLIFVQLLVSYIENNTETCNYKLSSEGKKFKLQKDRTISEKESWTNIKVKFGKIHINLDNLQISFKKSHGKIVISDFSRQCGFENTLNIDKTQVTRLTDIIKDEVLKECILNHFKVCSENYEAFIKNKKDTYLQFLKSNGYFEHTFVENLAMIFPNLDKMLTIFDLLIMANIYANYLTTTFTSFHSTCIKKIGKVVFFGYEIPMKANFPSYNLWIDSDNSNLRYAVINKYNVPTLTNTTISMLQSDMDNALLIASIQELSKKASKEEKSIIFYVKLDSNCDGNCDGNCDSNCDNSKLCNKDKENIDNFKIIKNEFNNFIEKIKNFDVVQSNENKIKIFNTLIERIEKKPPKEYGKHFKSHNNNYNNYGRNDYHTPHDHPMSEYYAEKEKEKNTKETKETKEVKTTEKDIKVKDDEVKNENKEKDIKVKDDEAKKEKNKEKDKEEENSDDDFEEFGEYEYFQNLQKKAYYSPPHASHYVAPYGAYGGNYGGNYGGFNNFNQQNMPKKFEFPKIPTVVTKEINEKYKSIDTLYLREYDYRRLVGILSRFKNSTYLYDKYGLPNKLGVLLYGEPGTGKSTTIQVIGSYLQKNIYYVNLSTVETNQELQMIFDEVNHSMNGGIIVFEDIDAMTNVVHDREITTVAEGDKLTLEYFLNLLQGSLTRNGTIFIATTNHLEKLDPAFYRVGRFDIKIDMKKCDHHQIRTIFEKFVGRSVDEEVLKKVTIDKFTPAEIIFHLVNFIDSEDSDEIIMRDFF